LVAEREQNLERGRVISTLFASSFLPDMVLVQKHSE
jgi:hypothetical protein